MKPIILESAAKVSKLEIEHLVKGDCIDITSRQEGIGINGTYKWDEVKQFVRELAEALDMTLEETAPEVEPIVLPKDVYDEVERFMKYIYSDENTVEIKRRADAKLWTNCRSDSGGHLATYIANKAGASIDIARIFMRELPYECENKRSWVLTVQSGNYLSKAYINDTGGWSLEYSRDIKEAIKFSSYVAAVKLEPTVSHVSTLEIEEV